jgi:serine/threonine-protein kinase
MPVSATDATPIDALPTSPLSIGDVVAERYRVKAVLGEGGMGVVYRVEHTHLRKAYALKVLLPEWSSKREMVARFEREAIAAGRIQSPHVVAATDFGRLADGSFFLVMEYVNGRTLRSVLEAEAGPLEPARALRILRGIVAALGAAHSLGIVHRDVKPENVMLVERDGQPDFVKVLDFGIAKTDELAGGGPASGTTALTRAGAIIGTLEYMAPEQALGQLVDARSDLYSAGVILFEMLTGQCPFRGGAGTMWRQHVVGGVPELPVDVAAKVDAGLGAILRRMLATSPDNRFENAMALVVALDGRASDSGRPAPGPSRPPVEPLQMTTPLAVRLRRSLLAGLDSGRAAARRLLADRGALLRHVTRLWNGARPALTRREGLARFVTRVRGTAGQALANREAFLRYVTRRRLAVGLVVVAVVATMAVALFGGETAPQQRSHAPVRARDPVVAVSPDSHLPPSSDLAAGARGVPVVSLPPPPSPSSSTEDDEDEPAQSSPGSTPPGRAQPRRNTFPW